MGRASSSIEMKKTLIVAAALAAALPAAKAGSAAVAALAFSSPTQDVSSQLDASQAKCREMEVQIDEGYGVSGRETRIVCRETP